MLTSFESKKSDYYYKELKGNSCNNVSSQSSSMSTQQLSEFHSMHSLNTGGCLNQTNDDLSMKIDHEVIIMSL